jgi:hypothetical protein
MSQTITTFSPQKPRFSLWPVLVEFLVKKVVLVLFFFEYFSYPVRIIPSVLHAGSVMYIISAVDVK